MRSLALTVDRSTFSLIWLSLHDRENVLLNTIEKFGEDSDDGSDALNDIIQLRLYKKELKELAEKIFDSNAFIV